MIGKPKHLTVGKGQTSAQAANLVANYAEEEQKNGASRAGQEGYYQKVDTPSRWYGEGARLLGLEGKVKREDLIEVLQGHLPNGEDISSRGGRQAERRMATDLTISVPKSVSILAIAGGDPRIDGVLQDAMEYTAKFIERESIVARIGKGGVETERTGKMVCAGYQHNDARMVDGLADPDWHMHLLIMNATQRADGRWVARDLDFGERNILRMTADYAMKAYLADRLQGLGYGIRITKDGFEIEGITQADIDAFSRRARQVDERLEAQGLTRAGSTTEQRDHATLDTREDKTKLSRVELTYQIRARVREHGLDLDALTREARERGPVAAHDISIDAVASAARHMGERESVFSHTLARMEAVKAGIGGATLESVEAAMRDGAGGLLNVGDGKLTTRDTLYREQEILAQFASGRDQLAPMTTLTEAQAVIERTEGAMGAGKSLSEGQRDAILAALTTEDRVFGIVGAWGVGKTTGAIRPIVAQAKLEGFHVIGMTPTTQAKKELLGANTDEVMTMAAWLKTKPETREDGTILRNEARLFVLDEGAMVGGADMDLVLKKLEMEGGRLLVVGDPQQLPSVGAGRPMKQAMDAGALRFAKITEVQRQTDPRLKQMAQVWADGDAKAAVAIAKNYMAEVTVTESDWKAAGKTVCDKPSREVRQAALVRETSTAYLALSAADRADTVLMTSTNKLRTAINARVREGLKGRGDIDANEVTLRAIDKVSLTSEQLSHPESYQDRPDLLIRMVEGRGAHRREVDWYVRGVERGRVILENGAGEQRRWNPATARSPSVYSSREIRLAVGDEVNFRDSSGLRNSQDRVDNGADAKVVRLDPVGPVVLLEDGREVTLRAEQAHPVDYGYCRTVHKAQGMTKGRAMYAVESVGQNALAQLAGVACTREKESLHILTDSPEKVGKVMEEWADHETAVAATKAATRGLALDTIKGLREEAQHDLGQAGDLAKAREVERESARAAQEEAARRAAFDHDLER